jgi:hypothetical protein
MEYFEARNQFSIDYIAQFDEYKMRCAIVEDEAMTLSRFRRGLNDDCSREIVLCGITTLDHTCTVVQDYELVNKS